MNYFYLTFISGYTYFSIMGLIIDIFYNDYQINKVDITKIKETYLNIFEKVSENVVINSIPIFLVIEFLYKNSEQINILYLIIQCFITIIIGINVDYFIHKLKHSKYFIKYHKEHHNLKIPLNSASTFYTHTYDFQLSLIPIIFPVILNFYPIIINLWILLMLFKYMIIEHSNIDGLSNLYTIHHKLGYCNYSLNIIDNYYNTLKTDNDNETIKFNKTCYSYICKTNKECYTPDCGKKKRIKGKLHYSNFF